jgi:hypothetical protein
LDEIFAAWERSLEPRMETFVPMWVQCDCCAKWRLCDPKVIEPFQTKKWTCDMTPDLRNRIGCQHDQEPWDEAWNDDNSDGEWQVQEPPITLEEILAMKDCGCCAVCRKKNRRGKRKTCVTKSELLKYVSEDKTEGAAQPVDDASVTTVATVPNAPNEIEVVDMDVRKAWQRLEDLEVCKKRGLITDSEYAEKRRRIIDDM